MSSSTPRRAERRPFPALEFAAALNFAAALITAAALIPATALVLCGPALADEHQGGTPTARAGIAAPVDREAAPLLWRVEAAAHNAGTPPGQLYLLGSIHVGPPEGWILAPALLEIFEQADALVVEIDMRGPDPAGQDDALMRYGLLPATESLKNHVSEETYASLREYLGHDPRALVNLNPWQAWMVATMLLAREVERLGYPAAAGVDLQFMKIAESGKPIVALETANEQLAMLGGMSDATQELMLKDTLLQMPNLGAHLDALESAWRRGDESKLASLLFRGLEEHPEFGPYYDRVVFDRNKTMGERLREITRGGGTYFAVVAAIHLVGSRSIPAYFSERGYTVTVTPLHADLSPVIAP